MILGLKWATRHQLMPTDGYYLQAMLVLRKSVPSIIKPPWCPHSRSILAHVEASILTSPLTLEHDPKYPNLSLCQRSWEGALFMHYLDHVFYIQFPFYNSTPTNAGRGWLFQLLMRDKSVYHAALALS
jgi:hypothetical protein